MNPPVAALYLTVSLDDSKSMSARRLHTTVKRRYGRPLEMITSL